MGYMGYNVGNIALSLASYYEAKEEAFRKAAEEDKVSK